MVKSNYVQIGRVAVVNYGHDAGKAVAILDVVDQSRALIQGPKASGVIRQTLPLRCLSFTHLLISKLPRSTMTAGLEKAWQKAKIDEEFAKTPWARKITQSRRRAQLTDFDRFNVMLLRKKKAKLLSKELSKLKKPAAGGKVKKEAKEAKGAKGGKAAAKK